MWSFFADCSTFHLRLPVKTKGRAIHVCIMYALCMHLWTMCVQLILYIRAMSRRRWFFGSCLDTIQVETKKKKDETGKADFIRMCFIDHGAAASFCFYDCHAPRTSTITTTVKRGLLSYFDQKRSLCRLRYTGLYKQFKDVICCNTSLWSKRQ